MNTRLLLTTVLAAMAGSAAGQITINESHLIQAGLTVVNSNSSVQIPIPSGGANQTWSFTNLNSSTKDTLKFGAATWFPGASNFAGANLGVDNGDSSYTFLRRNSTELSIVGGYSVNDGIGTVSDFGFRMLKLPCTYNTSFKDTTVLPQDPFEFGFDLDDGGPLPTIDSIALIVNLITQANADAWGSLTTPLGTNNVIRVNNMRTTHITARILVSGFWLDAPQAVVDSLMGSGPADTSYQCFFWTNNSAYGFPIMSYNYNNGDDSTSDISWLSAAPAMSGTISPRITSGLKAYPNPVSDLLQIQVPFKSGTLEVLDVNGRVVMKKNILEHMVIDMRNQTSGTYVVRAVSANGEIALTRVVKN